ncbi:MAG TPA: DUF5058 family protein [Candidatus Enterocloster excrementipullorum]|uniref:DUF5058 family protein n=1 Tax=Candidatus Enterocloster excrementipullorum TaxID=2838559 RepID=A0A9D2N1X4_9FIRM|nr:DUF5058 family protein [Candidatus Enterocloster excrementipullorum]
MQDYLSIANSGLMWAAVSVPMAVMAVQVYLLLTRSLKDGKRMGIKNEQIKSAVIASATASVGPSVSILAGMVSLMVMMGAPIAWMRLSYIGAVMYEMTSADVGAQAVGVAFEQSSMTAEAYANGVWAMTLGSIGWIIVAGLFTHKIDFLRTKLAGGDSKALPIITAAATLGCYCSLTFDKMYPVAVENKNIYAVIGGALTILALSTWNKKRKAKWVSNWSAPIAMVIGVACACIF